MRSRTLAPVLLAMLLCASVGHGLKKPHLGAYFIEYTPPKAAIDSDSDSEGDNDDESVGKQEEVVEMVTPDGERVDPSKFTSKPNGTIDNTPRLPEANEEEEEMSDVEYSKLRAVPMREYRISLEEVGYFLNDWNDAKDMTRILYASAQNCKTCMKIENDMLAVMKSYSEVPGVAAFKGVVYEEEAGFLINMTTVPSMHVWKVGSKWPEIYDGFPKSDHMSIFAQSVTGALSRRIPNENPGKVLHFRSSQWRKLLNRFEKTNATATIMHVFVNSAPENKLNMYRLRSFERLSAVFARDPSVWFVVQHYPESINDFSEMGLMGVPTVTMWRFENGTGWYRNDVMPAAGLVDRFLLGFINDVEGTQRLMNGRVSEKAGVIQELQQFVAPLIGGAFQDKQASKRLLWAASKRRKYAKEEFNEEELKWKEYTLYCMKKVVKKGLEWMDRERDRLVKCEHEQFGIRREECMIKQNVLDYMLKLGKGEPEEEQ